jgi:hypothetical protein
MFVFLSVRITPPKQLRITPPKQVFEEAKPTKVPDVFLIPSFLSDLSLVFLKSAQQNNILAAKNLRPERSLRTPKPVMRVFLKSFSQKHQT